MSKKQAQKGSPKDDGRKIVARNQRARFEYEILERIEAGLVLQGTEVKSLRGGQASLADAYARVDGEEIFLHKMHIPEYEQRGYATHDPRRRRKLLLHRSEIKKLVVKLVERGLTLVPTQLYFRNGYAKVELALARGKKLHDKRETMKKRSVERDMRRIVR